MVQSYREDSSVSEAGGLGRFGELMSSLGRGLSSIGNVFLGLIPGGITGSTFLGGAATLPFTSLQIPLIAPMLGAITAAGGVMKGVSDIASGRRKKGTKEIIKGLAEGTFVGIGALVVMAAAVPGFFTGAGLMLAAGEIVSKVSTGKTLAAHFGNAVGAVLDATMGTQETPKRQNVNIMQAQGMGMQQQMGLAPQMMMPQPEYGQMMAPGGMAYSAVPAGVGMPQMMMQQQPPQDTRWRDQVTANNPRYQQQAQEPVMLAGAEAGRYSNAVEVARDAAATNPELTNR